ncbi:restriction endonuclease subunit S [Pseudoalteromonas sp. Q18-MNA-CIBAN-0097]|uniref:restriction endonuclease subunit S n=1 Tax=Pseudoalteromonas sp. Q18-MNA-CIBAN-0097 TaxID=3140440 RepID=UPI003326989F
MQNKWPLIRLSDCAKFQEGYVNPSQKHEEYFGEDIKWLRATDLNNANVYETSRKLSTIGFQSAGKSAYLFKPDTIGISKSGTIGRVGILKDYMCGNRAVINIQVNDKVANTKFIFYILKHYRPSIEQLAIGSVQPNLYTSALGSLEFFNPDLKTQNKIVNILSSLDDKIELNQQTNQTLEQMAQTLFKSWFVDFDPVFDNLLAKADFNLANLENTLPEPLFKKAKARLSAINASASTVENKSADNIKASLTALSQSSSSQLSARNVPEIDATSATILPQHSNHAHFPSEFEHNEQLGWIPKGWAASTTGDEFVVKGGSTPSTKNADFWDDGEIHWTSPKDLSGKKTKIMLDTNRKITELGLTKITSGLLPIDTVLMSSRAPVGYLALAKVPVAINQGYIAITDAKTLSSEYTIQWLDSVMDEIKSISGGTTFAEISKKTFKSIQLIIPSKTVVDVYTKMTKAYYERITANVQEINTLTETRDYLLPKLISGEITLPDSQISSEA